MPNLGFSKFCQTDHSNTTEGTPGSNFLEYRVNQHWPFIFYNLFVWKTFFFPVCLFGGEGLRVFFGFPFFFFSLGRVGGYTNCIEKTVKQLVYTTFRAICFYRKIKRLFFPFVLCFKRKH